MQLAAKNFRRGSEGAAEGGCGGNSAAPKPKRSPAALLVQSRTPHKSFLFLLEEKNRRAQNQEKRRKFFCGEEGSFETYSFSTPIGFFVRSETPKNAQSVREGFYFLMENPRE